MMHQQECVEIKRVRNAGQRCGALAAAMLLLLSYAPLQASDLTPFGRLLTTPNQRDQLDQLRKNTGKAIPQAPQYNDDVIVVVPTPLAPAPAAKAATALEAQKPIVFNGYVKRSDGTVTTWLNQEALSEAVSSRVLGLDRKATGRQLNLTLPNGKYLSAKPGQTIHPDAALVADDLHHGKISIKQAPSSATEHRP